MKDKTRLDINMTYFLTTRLGEFENTQFESRELQLVAADNPFVNFGHCIKSLKRVCEVMDWCYQIQFMCDSDVIYDGEFQVTKGGYVHYVGRSDACGAGDTISQAIAPHTVIQIYR